MMTSKKAKSVSCTFIFLYAGKKTDDPFLVVAVSGYKHHLIGSLDTFLLMVLIRLPSFTARVIFHGFTALLYLDKEERRLAGHGALLCSFCGEEKELLVTKG